MSLCNEGFPYMNFWKMGYENAIFTKRHNFCDFLFSNLGSETCMLLGEKILFLKADLSKLLPLKVYPFTFTLDPISYYVHMSYL